MNKSNKEVITLLATSMLSMEINKMLVEKSIEISTERNPFEAEPTMVITNPYEFVKVNEVSKSGKENRRQRRSNKRKNK